MNRSSEQEQEQSGLTELVQVINNPQHEVDAELPGPNPSGSDSNARNEDTENFMLDPF